MKIVLGKVPLVDEGGNPLITEATPFDVRGPPHQGYQPADVRARAIELPHGAHPLCLIEDYSSTWPNGTPCSGRWFKSLVYYQEVF